MNTKAILTRAKELIEQGWTQKTSARNSNGKIRSAYDSDACQFCMIGAIDRAAFELTSGSLQRTTVAREAVDQLHSRLMMDTYGKSVSVAMFNDATGRTKREVLEAFERTIGAQSC